MFSLAQNVYDGQFMPQSGSMSSAQLMDTIRFRSSALLNIRTASAAQTWSSRVMQKLNAESHVKIAI